MTPVQNAQNKTSVVAFELAKEFDEINDMLRMRMEPKWRNKSIVNFRRQVALRFLNNKHKTI